MHFKLLTFLLSLFILVSCSTAKKTLNVCNLQKAGLRGQEDGKLGLNHIEKHTTNCPHQSRLEYKESYLEGQKKGLKNYCTKKRAQIRAQSHLEIDGTCKEIESYKAWYDKALLKSCSVSQAKMDAKKGRPKHNLCLQTKVYNRYFNLDLQKHCTQKQAFKLGFEKKELSKYCLNTDKKDSLLKNYKMGVIKGVESENVRLEIKVSELNTQIKELKKLSPTSKEQRRKLEIKKEEVSKELLKTLHTLGKKNKL
jgi:hypothetical protein